MIKFENIKVGDTVYVEKDVSYGWHKAETFYLPKIVTKVTKTQLTVEGGRRFSKERGKEVGASFSYAKSLGDKKYYAGGETVKDETNEMNIFKEKLKLEKSIREQIEGLNIEYNSGLKLDQLKSIERQLTVIKSTIESN